MENVEVIAKSAAALDAYRRMLGPSFDYLGEVLRNRTEKTVDQFGEILKSARWKLGDEIEEDGSVPPRIIKDVLEEGAYFENEIAAEYFGGIVAASRSKDGKDDRGATYTKLLGRLSTYQISVHHVLYTVIRKVYTPSDENLSSEEGRSKLETFAPLILLGDKIGFEKSNIERNTSILDHSLFGLYRENLISNFKYGPTEDIRGVEDGEMDGVKFVPSEVGIDLYLWAHGHGDLLLKDFLNPSTDFKSNVEVELSPEIQVLKKVKWEDSKDFSIPD